MPEGLGWQDPKEGVFQGSDPDGYALTDLPFLVAPFHPKLGGPVVVVVAGVVE